MGYIKFLVIKGSHTYDMSELVESIKWSGRRGGAARSVTVSLLDDDGYGHDRPGIDCEEGHQCIFYWKGEEIFRGLFINNSQSNKKKMSVKAYDNGIYLANNKDSFTYSNKTAAAVFKDCMSRCKMTVDKVADTGYVIPELTKPKTTYFDVIADALSRTYKATGKRFYVISKGGKISLLKRTENMLQWVVETGVNLIDYNYSKSIENTKTRIRLLTKEGKLLAEEVDSDLEKKIGIFQDVDTPDDSLNKAQLKELVKSTLKASGPTRKLTVSALGIPEAYSGMCIYIIIKELGIKKTYYIDEDTHTFKGNNHTMKLSLMLKSDINNTE
jgi:hypothetical protein